MNTTGKKFICVLKLNRLSAISAIQPTRVVEKLFIPFPQYDEWRRRKNESDGNLFGW
jgi:hypothetical protein